MNCWSCQAVNPDAAKFCVNCGSRLQFDPATEGPCRSCAAPLPLAAKFCGYCGTPEPLDPQVEPASSPQTESPVAADPSGGEPASDAGALAYDVDDDEQTDDEATISRSRLLDEPEPAAPPPKPDVSPRRRTEPSRVAKERVLQQRLDADGGGSPGVYSKKGPSLRGRPMPPPPKLGSGKGMSRGASSSGPAATGRTLPPPPPGIGGAKARPRPATPGDQAPPRPVVGPAPGSSARADQPAAIPKPPGPGRLISPLGNRPPGRVAPRTVTEPQKVVPTADPPRPLAGPPQPLAKPPQPLAGPPQPSAKPPQSSAGPPQSSAGPPQPLAKPPQPLAGSPQSVRSVTERQPVVEPDASPEIDDSGDEQTQIADLRKSPLGMSGRSLGGARRTPRTVTEPQKAVYANPHPSEAAALLAPPEGWPDVTDELAEVRFSSMTGDDTEVRTSIAALQARYPGHPEIDALAVEFGAVTTSTSPPESVPEPARAPESAMPAEPPPSVEHDPSNDEITDPLPGDLDVTTIPPSRTAPPGPAGPTFVAPTPPLETAPADEPAPVATSPLGTPQSAEVETSDELLDLEVDAVEFEELVDPEPPPPATEVSVVEELELEDIAETSSVPASPQPHWDAPDPGGTQVVRLPKMATPPEPVHDDVSFEVLTDNENEGEPAPVDPAPSEVAEDEISLELDGLEATGQRPAPDFVDRTMMVASLQPPAPFEDGFGDGEDPAEFDALVSLEAPDDLEAPTDLETPADLDPLDELDANSDTPLPAEAEPPANLEPVDHTGAADDDAAGYSGSQRQQFSLSDLDEPTDLTPLSVDLPLSDRRATLIPEQEGVEVDDRRRPTLTPDAERRTEESSATLPPSDVAGDTDVAMTLAPGSDPDAPDYVEVEPTPVPFGAASVPRSPTLIPEQPDEAPSPAPYDGPGGEPPPEPTMTAPDRDAEVAAASGEFRVSELNLDSMPDLDLDYRSDEPQAPMAAPPEPMATPAEPMTHDGTVIARAPSPPAPYGPDGPAVPLRAVRLVMLGARGEPVAERRIEAGAHLDIGRHPGEPWAEDRRMEVLHARMFPGPGGVVVDDFGLPNGVYTQIFDTVAVQDGDEFKVGQARLALARTDPASGRWGELTLVRHNAPTPELHPLEQAEVIIGRDEGDVTLPDDTFVSGDHCRFSVEGHAIYLEDLGSSNGTYIRVRAGQCVEYGRLLLVGHTQFKVEEG